MIEQLKEFGYASAFELAKKTANIPAETTEIVLMKPVLGLEKNEIGDVQRLVLNVQQLRAAAFEEIMPKMPEKEQIREMVISIKRLQQQLPKHPFPDSDPIKIVVDFLNNIYLP